MSPVSIVFESPKQIKNIPKTETAIPAKILRFSFSPRYLCAKTAVKIGAVAVMNETLAGEV